MSLALLVLYLWFTSNRKAAFLDFANKVAPRGARLGARQKSKQHDMGDLWAKWCFWKNLNQNIPNTPEYKLN